jgi:PAS domain S-box-containing protein
MQRLPDAEVLWRALAQSLPDFVGVFDREGRLLYINRTVPQFAPETVMGTRIYDYLPPETVSQVQRLVADTFESAEPRHHEVRGIGQGNAMVWYSLKLVPLVENGRTQCVLFIGLDLTLRREAEERLRQNEERLRVVLEATNDGVWELDLEAGRVSWSDRIYEMLHLEPGSVDLGYGSILGLIHPDDVRQAEATLHAHLESGTPFAVEERLRQVRAGIPILLMSGFAASAAEHEAQAFGIDQWLAKPFSLHSLGSAILRALRLSGE